MIEWCLKNRKIVAVLSIFIFFSGAYVYMNMERQENPDVVSPGATVQVIYPGATPEEVEKFIVKPLETKINEITGIKLMTSYSLDNVGVIVVRLEDLTDAQITDAWNKLKDKVDETELPEQAYDPEINTDLVETYGMLFTVSSDQLDYKQLKKISDELKDHIEKEEGVSEVVIDGYEEDEIHINLDILKMKHFNLSMDQIATVLMARNVNIPGGTLELEQSKVAVSTTGEYKTISDIENTIVGMSETGNVIYVKDIADVSIQEAKREIFVHSNAEKSLLLSVKYSEGQNVVKTGERLVAYLEEYKKSLPEDVTIRIITDQASYVNDAIKTFESNLL
ncbi:MAG: efflux RND transporter permease subunit, partial [Epulopiscium sp.]|nr:efflux RND transporter permease subunit [Candidatus Epulonipiscium sp.]